MKRYILSALVAIVAIPLFAVPADPTPFRYTLPDGTTVMAQRHGDEFHSYITSMEGKLLEGTLDAEVQKKANVRRRMPRSAGSYTFPTKGSPRSLVLLVGFSDLPFDQSRQDFQDLLTKTGYDHNGATGSCRDYYIASSDSIFSPQFDCFGPFTVSQKMAYYGANAGTSNSQHAAEMVAEACQLAHEAGVNFKDYDTNNDGLLDNVFIFFAGHNEAEGGGANTIWPHAGDISRMSLKLDGVTVGSYACTSEYKGSAGKTRCGIGTFCHEFGHVIGQPDFYDTDYNFYTVGNWDIMCQGSYNNNGNTPPLFSAWERMYEGWLTPKQLSLPGNYALSATPFHAEAYLIAAETHNMNGTMPTPSEFFILENRNSNNVWDSYLPGHGMLVWHIDYSASAWSQNVPNNGPTLMRMHLEEANGIGWKKRSQSASGTAGDPYPGSMAVTTFTPTLHNGTVLADQPLFNIEEKGGIVTFTYISMGKSSLKADKKELHFVTTVSDNKQIVDWTPESFELLGASLDPEEEITVRGNNNFRLYIGDEAPALTSSAWKASVSLKPNTDSIVEQRVWVSFRPTAKSCTTTSGVLTVSSSAASLTIPVYGDAPRPTYVTTPEVKEIAYVTPYSFRATWGNVEDAELYYLTLFQRSEGESKYVQGFEDFDDNAKVLQSGWKTNTNQTTTYAKADGTKSLAFTSHGDQITSETYPSPVTSMSFWYNSFTSTVDTIGVLEVEAFNGTDWEMADQVIVTNKAKRVTASYDFEAEKNYIAFRITWIDNGGAGLALDAFTATISEKIDYIYRGSQLYTVPTFDGTDPYYTFSNLEPESDYYFQIQCTDLDKGCEEHLTALSEPIEVRTLAGEPLDGKAMTIGYDSLYYSSPTRVVYLTEPKTGDRLYFFDTAGRQVYSIKVYTGAYSYALPESAFRRGEVYMVQHAKEGKLGRKNKRVKFIFQ